MKSTLTTLLFIVITIYAKAQENIIWKFKTGDRVYSSPVSNGNHIYFGSGDEHIYALNKATGEKVWSFKTDGPVHSSGTFYKNTVFFGSADGSLYAIDKNDGKLRWKFNSEGESIKDLWDYYLSSPREKDGIIYWGSGDGHLYAINAISGELTWKVKTDGIVHGTPSFNENSVFIGSFDGNLYNLNKETGELKWKFKTMGETYFPLGGIQKGALIHDDKVYFGSRDYNMYALDIHSGEKIWTLKDSGGWIISTPIPFKNGIYFGSSDGHVFYATDQNTGELKWKAPIPLRSYGSPVAYNDTIYFGTFDGKILGLNYKTGKLVWEFQTESSRKNYGTIYNKEGHFKEGFQLYGDNFETVEAQIHELGSILCTPLIEKNIIYFTSSDGYIYAVNLP